MYARGSWEWAGVEWAGKGSLSARPKPKPTWPKDLFTEYNSPNSRQTESEAEAQADENPAIPRRPDWRMQEATAEEAEAEFHASKPAKERIKEDVEKAVEDVKKAVSCC